MGDLLLNWLNDEIQLSRKVTQFEQDFHNGFLFGELLAKYSQQLNFHEFVDRDDKAARINNFSLLMDTFTALRVTFDSNIAIKIINRELGFAKKLLYELKTQLEKTNDNAFSKTNRLNKTLTPLKKIQISKERFDQVTKEHFVKQLNQLHPAQKEIIEQSLLKKFVDFEHKNRLKAAQEEEKARQAKLLLQSKFNEQERENIKKSEEFRKQWEADHLEKWAANRSIRQTQVAKDEQYRSKLQTQKMQSRTMSEMNAMRALDNDIAAFQRKNLPNRLPDDSDSDKEQVKLTKTISQKPQQPKVREQPKDERRFTGAQNQKKKHQRQKRRRKMIVQQQKRYQMVQIARRQRCIIATIEQTSKQQKEIQYQIWRAWQNKNVILDNRLLVDEKVKDKNETRDINAKFKKDELLKLYREEHKAEVAAGVTQTTALQRVHQVSGRKRDYKQCQTMIEELLELTENMYTSCQQRNSQQIDNAQLQASLIRFVEGVKSPQQENALKVKHYIEASNEWGFPIVRPEEEVPTDPKEDNSLPNGYVNNYYLGNVLRNVFEKQIGSPPKEIYSSPPNKALVSLIGLDFARKHYVAEKVAVQHGFTVIEVDKLIESKLKDWQDFKKRGIEVSQQTERIAAQSFAGLPVDEKLIIKLIKEQTDKHPISVLLDYPNTYEQAIELCRVISNVSPKDMIDDHRLARKIKEFERLVKSSETKVVPRQLRECGVDFVWWIDVSPQNSLDRMLGRRWIGTTEVHINDDIEPYNLREGEKASALAMRNHFKLKNKDKLQNWFNMFGTEFGSTEPVSQSCWQYIEGNCDKQQLEGAVLAKLKQVLLLKEKQKQWTSLQQEQEKKAQEGREQQAKQRQLTLQKCGATPQDKLKQELGQALGKSELDRPFIDQTADLWNRIESTTINSLIRVFQSLQQQQSGKRNHIAQVKRSFIALLTRDDHKFHLIKEFQIKYNRFLTDNQDMLSYDYTKEELHQRVEDLENDLITVVEEKKEDAIADRSGVMGSGWLQSQLEIISSSLHVLVQTELSRFAVAEKLLVDYYAKRFMVNSKAYEPLTAELNNQAINSLDSFKDGTCPRLEKTIAEALRILNRQEEVLDDKAKKGGKAPPKKEEKKAAKKGGKDEVEEVKEPTAEEHQLKKAINTEKAILRQRLNRIKTFGSIKLKNTYGNMQKLYSQLEDLYLYTYKTECKAIFSLTKIFKKAIEKEQRIESEVQIHHVQVTQTEHIRNFEKEKPTILPAQEQLSPTHFTLSNIYEIIKLFKQQAEGPIISTKRLTILLKRLVTNPQLKKLLPSSWKTVTAEQAENFAQLLDYPNAAYVSLIKVFVFVLLTGFTVPTEDQLEQYNLDLTHYSSLKELPADIFIATPAWFDQPIEQKQNIRPFLRNNFVKQVLFDLFKRQDGLVDISQYVQAVSLSEFAEVKALDGGETTYFDYAFA